MFHLLKTIFSDSDEGESLSWMRVIGFLVLSYVMGLWGVACYHAQTFVDIPSNALMVVLVVISGKVTQSLFENAASVKEKEIEKD